MAQTIKYNGQDYQFPDDATDDEITEALNSVDAQPQEQSKPDNQPIQQPGSSGQPIPQQSTETAPEQPTSLLGKIGQFAKGVGTEAAHTIAQDVGKAVKGVNQFAEGGNGQDTNSLSKKVTSFADTLLTNSDSVYANRMRELQSNAGQAGAQLGGAIGSTIEYAVPGVGAVMTAGKAYEAQPEGEKSVAGALGESAVESAKMAAMGKIGGFVGGRILGKIAPKVIGETASKMIGESPLARTVTKIAGGAATGAVVGGTTGAIQAGAEGLMNGKSMEEVGEEAKEAAKTGAEVGALMGGVHAPFTKPVAEHYTPEMKEKVKTQAEEYSKASNPTQKNEIMAKSPELQKHSAIQAMDKAEIPIAPSLVGDKVKPLTSSELATPIKTSEGVKTTVGAQVEKGFNDFHKKTINTIEDAKDTVSGMIKRTGQEYKSEAVSGGKIKAQAQAPLETYKDTLTAHLDAIKSGDTARIAATGKDAQHAFEDLHPLEKKALNERKQELTGDKSAIDHVEDAHTYNQVSKNVETMLPGKAVKTESGAFQTGVNLAHGFLHGAVHNIPGGKFALGLLNTTLEHANPITVGKRVVNKTRFAEASEAAQAGKGVTERAQGEGFEPQIPGQEQPVLNRYAAKRFAENQKAAVEAERAKIFDPELKKLITAENMTPEHIAEIKKMDASRNVEKIRKANEIKNTANQNTWNVKHEAETNELNRWHKEEGSIVPQEYVDAAKKQVMKQTPKGGRLLNAGRVKEIAMRNFESKAGVGSTIKGTKSEFYHAIAHELPAEAREKAKAHVDKLYGNDKQLTEDKLKDAWKDVYEMGAEQHEKAGNNTEAKNLRKLATRNVNTLNSRAVSAQHNTLDTAIKQSLEEAHKNIGDEKLTMTPDEQSEYIDNQLSQIFKGRKEPMTATELKNKIQEVKEQASKHAEEWADKTVAERAKTTGANEEDVKSLENVSVGKIGKEESTHILNDIKRIYVSAADNGNLKEALASHHGIVNHIDTKGGRVAMHNRFETELGVVADRQEKLPKGADKKALVSQEQYKAIADGNSLGYKEAMLEIAGVDKPEQLLRESERAKLEDDIMSGRKAEQEAKANTKAKLGALAVRTKGGRVLRMKAKEAPVEAPKPSPEPVKEEAAPVATPKDDIKRKNELSLKANNKGITEEEAKELVSLRGGKALSDTMKVIKSSPAKAPAPKPKPVLSADEKELAKLKRRLFGAKSEDYYRKMKGNDYGQVYKADLGRYNYLKERVQKAKRNS